MNFTQSVALLGNVGPGSPEFSTENEYLRAYQHHNVEVIPFNERRLDDWESLIELLASSEAPDYVQWTSTHSWRAILPTDLQLKMLQVAGDNAVAVVGVHLDRFWGIPVRERWIREGDPYFKCHLLLTADGGNQDKWESAKVRHRWLLPAVGERYCHRGKVRDEYRGQVAFVGSWYKYHRESRHRSELVHFLTRNYQANLWPKRNNHAIRGDDLTDLYWSTDLVVGDSFFPSRGQHLPPSNYCSDRIPESLGRGAMLLHVEVPGITDGPFDTPNLDTWSAWRWRELQRKIDESLSMTANARTRKRNLGIEHIKEHHTYERRVEEIFDVLVDEGLL